MTTYKLHLLVIHKLNELLLFISYCFLIVDKVTDNKPVHITSSIADYFTKWMLKMYLYPYVLCLAYSV